MKDIEDVLKENWNEHTSENFIKCRDKEEQILLKKVEKKGFEWFKNKAIDKLKCDAEDSDLFWELTEEEEE